MKQSQGKTMKTSSIKSILLAVFLATACAAWAQPAFDECNAPIFLPDVSDWCSNPGQYSNVSATASAYGPSPCWTGVTHDIWFSFVATATAVSITVNGASGNGAGGTLQGPEVALYTGNCGGTITNLQCGSDAVGANIEQIYRGSLNPGQLYFIRVDGRNLNTGTFQLCVNNYNELPSPGSDCATATLLCDKSPFSVQSVIGAGNNPNEAAGSCLGGLGGNSESNSTWFKWICQTSGTLTFTLTPSNPSDDIDFVLYELPNGYNNCAGKIERRCMAAGDFVFPSPCMGPTGLRTSSNDVSEPPGCNGGNDSWVAALNMTAGTAYALMVNNFTSTGNGFSVEFGGTGTFRGPIADFVAVPSTICSDVPVNVQFNDNSSFQLGSITNRTWNFGLDSQPSTANGTGPFSVTYNSHGLKYITLTVETDLGCVVTDIETIRIGTLIDYTYTATPVECFGDLTGTINLDVAPDALPYRYNWGNGFILADTFGGLNVGTYQVTITDGFCDTVVSYSIPGPPPYTITDSMTLATCAGGQDGQLFLNVSGATPGYSYLWSTGATTSSISGLPIGSYTVTITDANNCTETLSLNVNELELLLDSALIQLIDPLCAGESTGAITLDIANGSAPFEYNWGNGFLLNDNQRQSLPEGNYTVIARDANGCLGNFTLTLDAPPQLTLGIDSFPVSCFGDTDGRLTANAGGGVGSYQYYWFPSFQSDTTAIDLAPGSYSVTVTDGNGCTITGTSTVNEPAPVFVERFGGTDISCFGYTDGTAWIVGGGGTAPYNYTLDGGTFQVDTLFTNLAGGTYTLQVQDASGCIIDQPITLFQPQQIFVDAGESQTIDLGYSANLVGAYSPQNPSTYQWSPAALLDCDTCQSVNASPTAPTFFHLTVTNENGCFASDSVLVLVNLYRPVFIPNAFTPTADGLNDAFHVFGNQAITAIRSMKIFDRWGELLFDAQNIQPNQPSVGWDGTFKGRPMNTGVYVYLIDVEFDDGVIQQFSGDITLLR